MHQTPNEIDAHALKGFLEENGIEAVIRAPRARMDNPTKETEKGIVSRHSGGQNIFVRKEEKHRAEALVYHYLKQHEKPPV